MKLYKLNDTVYQEPLPRGFDLDNAVEITSPIKEDGTVWLSHPSLHLCQTKEDGTLYTYYLPDMVDGKYVPDLVKEQEVQMDNLISTYKGYYMEVLGNKLAELDYDSLATVKLWEGDATFGAEATAILTWYKTIIEFNYGMINDIKAGTIDVPTKEAYLAALPQYGA